MKRKLSIGVVGLLALVALSIGLFGIAAVVADDDDDDDKRGRRYKVTVTNLTRGQIISPPVVATHNNKLAPLFVLGEPASSELAEIAEDAVSGPLEAALSEDSNVGAVETIGGVILPGESAYTVIEAKGKFRQVTVVGMLVTTNDAFFALNGVDGPKERGSKVYMSPAYDSGTEANNELCMYIPGPPCGNPLQHPDADPEGSVHIHAGIHGTGDLVPAIHDWRNPVALVTIERMR